jgi:hypothetical protein
LKSTRVKDNNITEINKQHSVRNLAVNGLNSPIKRCRIVDWIKENKIQQYVVCKMHPTGKYTEKELKLKEWKIICQRSGNQRQAGVNVSVKV